jgi:hypothetical protein
MKNNAKTVADMVDLSAIETEHPRTIGARVDVDINTAERDNEGASFLAGVRDAVIEQAGYIAPADWAREMCNGGEMAHEIADGAPNVYTAVKWGQFYGVYGWDWDASDLIDPAAGMDAAAGVVLYDIARHIIADIADDIQGLIDDADDDDETNAA